MEAMQRNAGSRLYGNTSNKEILGGDCTGGGGGCSSIRRGGGGSSSGCSRSILPEISTTMSSDANATTMCRHTHTLHHPHHQQRRHGGELSHPFSTLQHRSSAGGGGRSPSNAKSKSGSFLRSPIPSL